MVFGDVHALVLCQYVSNGFTGTTGENETLLSRKKNKLALKSYQDKINK